MYNYIFKRILVLIPILLGVIMIIFILSEISVGDPAREIAGERASEEDIMQIREELGLNDPMPVRFTKYVSNIVLHADFGTSFTTKRPVLDEVLERFPTTLLLASLSMVLMLVIGIPIGIISATRQYSWIDHLSTMLGLVGVSMPTFWMGLMNILIFSIYLRWLPASGFYSWKHWILPVIAIGTANAAQIMRMTRSSMLDVVRQDYIRAARAKGLSENTIIMKHAIKNALIPILTVIGITFGVLLSGTIVTETVFAIPGLGKYMVDGIKTRNYPVIQGGTLMIAIVFSFVTLGVDILYAFIDPRLKSMYVGTKKNGSKKTRHKEVTTTKGGDEYV